ncbi:MAG: VOC family protein [Acidobacteriota bacterium]
MTPPVFGTVAPQFVVPDLEATARYYRDRLGFEITDRFLDPPVHIIMTRGYVQIFLALATGEAGRSNRRRLDVGIDAYIRVEGLRALASELRARGATILEGPVRRVYDQEELVVEDCNGFVLVFGEAAPPN